MEDFIGLVLRLIGWIIQAVFELLFDTIGEFIINTVGKVWGLLTGRKYRRRRSSVSNPAWQHETGYDHLPPHHPARLAAARRPSSAPDQRPLPG